MGLLNVKLVVRKVTTGLQTASQIPNVIVPSTCGRPSELGRLVADSNYACCNYVASSPVSSEPRTLVSPSDRQTAGGSVGAGGRNDSLSLLQSRRSRRHRGRVCLSEGGVQLGVCICVTRG